MTIEDRFKRLRDPQNWLPEFSEPTPQSGPARRARILAPIAISTAAVAALAVVGATYWGSGGPGTQAGGPRTAATTRPATHASVVPWQPLRPTARPTAAGTTGTATHTVQSATCKASVLQVTVGGPNGAGGTTYLRLTVKNQGPSACTLHDSDLQIGWDGHNPIDLNPYARRDQTLPPGGTGNYRLGFSGSCVTVAAPSSITYTPVEMSIDGVAATVHGNGIPSTVASCTSATFGAFATTGQASSTPQAGSTPRTGSGAAPYSQLSASIHLPASITAGGTTTYTLELTNDAATPFTFADCPSYTEEVNVASHTANRLDTERYTLNCNGISIPAGGKADFAMQIDLPDVPEAYLAKFGWFMDNGPSDATATRLS